LCDASDFSTLCDLTFIFNFQAKKISNFNRFSTYRGGFLKPESRNLHLYHRKSMLIQVEFKSGFKRKSKSIDLKRPLNLDHRIDSFLCARN